MRLKGKPISLTAKIVSIALVLLGLIAKMSFAPLIPFDDVLKAAGFMVLVCSPIDASLVIEALLGQKASSLPEGR